MSNPGCYATNMQMLIAPMLPYVDPACPPTVVGISGYSGAGTKSGGRPAPGQQPVTLPKIAPEDLHGGLRPYALTDHIHEREARFHLSRLAGVDVNVAFTPIVAPWFQGIIATASIPLKTSLTAKNVRELFEEKYAGEPLVQIQSGVPEIRDIALQHGFKAGGFQVHSSGDRVVIVGVIDNLLKGAATQCLQVRTASPALPDLQNLNLAMGFDEHAGIPALA